MEVYVLFAVGIKFFLCIVSFICIMANNILLIAIKCLCSCSTGTLIVGSLIGLWVLLAVRFPIFPGGRQVFREEHAYKHDKYSWRPPPHWRIEGIGISENVNNCRFYSSAYSVYRGPRGFRPWDRIKNRHAWTMDNRTNSPTFGLSALSSEVSANFNAVLAGNPNPPPIHWTMRFTGL